MNKRGISAVMTTLVIILLVMVAIGIVWIVVKNIIQSGSEDVTLGRFTLDLEVKSAYIDGEYVKVKVKRNPGQGALTGVKFIFSDGTDTFIVDEYIVLEETEEHVFTFNSTQVGGIDSVLEVSVVPLYESAGQTKAGDIIDTAVISGSAPPGDGNGNGGDDSFYEKSFTVSSDEFYFDPAYGSILDLVPVDFASPNLIPVNVDVNSSYDNFTLYWLNGSEWVNASSLFNFSVSGSSATFYGFDITSPEVLYEVTGDAYYVATNGDDSNPGTINEPFASIQHGINMMSPGDILYIRGGIYYTDTFYNIYQRKGTESQRFTISAYPGEEVIVDGTGSNPWSGHGLFRFKLSDYWVIKNLKVRNSPDSAFRVHNEGHYLFIECEAYDNRQGFSTYTGSEGTSFPTITYVRCKSYRNYDPPVGTAADGFGSDGYLTYIDCEASYNSDDGFDFIFLKGNVTLIRCIAHSNGQNIWNEPTFNGDGWGFKIAPHMPDAKATLIDCVAYNNSFVGICTYVTTGTLAPSTVYGLTTYHNGYECIRYAGRNIHMLKHEVANTVRNSISYDGYTADQIHENVDDQFNSWNLGVDPAECFASLDSSNPDFLHLDPDGPCVDAGVDVGLPYSGSAPDLGAYEIFSEQFKIEGIRKNN